MKSLSNLADREVQLLLLKTIFGKQSLLLLHHIRSSFHNNTICLKVLRNSTKLS